MSPPHRASTSHDTHLRYFADSDCNLPAEVRLTAEVYSKNQFLVQAFRDARFQANIPQIQVEWRGFPNELDLTWEPVTQLLEDLPTAFLALFLPLCSTPGPKPPSPSSPTLRNHS